MDNNLAIKGFNDYISNPYEMYILAENGTFEVSPGIIASAALGAYDLFGQDFISFMITDWRNKEHNFEFFLDYSRDPPFELLTVNSGSLSSGQANISFVITNGTESEYGEIILGIFFAFMCF